VPILRVGERDAIGQLADAWDDPAAMPRYCACSSSAAVQSM
jgi:hypothetical protein